MSRGREEEGKERGGKMKWRKERIACMGSHSGRFHDDWLGGNEYTGGQSGQARRAGEAQG